VFAPFAKVHHIDDTKPIVLTMDGHDTHENPHLKHAVYDLQDTEGLHIKVICFPSKTTHKCQLLDVLVFSVMERRWQAVCKEYLRQCIPIN
jgi:DDE superfamily endonuclease